MMLHVFVAWGLGISILQRGFDLLIVPDYLLIFLIFPENSPCKWNSFVSKGGSNEPLEPPLDPPLHAFTVPVPNQTFYGGEVFSNASAEDKSM